MFPFFNPTRSFLYFQFLENGKKFYAELRRKIIRVQSLDVMNDYY